MNPVIFLPGILGSALRDSYDVDLHTVFSARSMLPLADMFSDDYTRIALHPDDQRFERLEPARIEAEGVIPLIYKEFILELRHSLAKDPSQPTPVVPMAYDWRQPLETTEDRLEALIEETIDRTRLLRHYADSPWNRNRRVNLVGHSMGGLVIAGLLARKPELARRIGKVATIGTPYRGSVEAVTKVCMGTSTLGAEGSSSREREAARITPALYYLVPDYAGATRPGTDLFDHKNWQASVIDTLLRYQNAYSVRFNNDATAADAAGLLGSMLEQAGRHRRRIAAVDGIPGGLARQNWLAIAGTGAKTRTRIDVATPSKRRPQFDFPAPEDDAGDGTVPLASAVPTFLEPRHLVCVSGSDFSLGEIGDRLLRAGAGLHAALPSMNLVQRLVVSLFQGDREGDAGGRPFPGVTAAQWLPPSKLDIKP
jgi:pimeloyl-ACP methyl ester carboxylesterase